MHLNQILVDLKVKNASCIFWTKLGNYGHSGEEGVESSAAPIPLVQTSLGMMQGRKLEKKGWYLSRTFLSIPSNYIRSLIYFFLHTSIPAFTKKIVKLSWMEFSNTVHFMNIDTSKYSARVWSRLNAPNMGAVAAADLDPVEAAAAWA